MVCALPLTTGIASASTAQGSLDDANGPDIAESGRRIAVPAFSDRFSSAASWVWARGRRLYTLTDRDIDSTSTYGFGSIRSVDLETGVEVSSVPLKPAAYAGYTDRGRLGAPHVVTVDEDGGRVFVAYRVRGTSDLGGVPAEPASAARGEMCSNQHKGMLGGSNGPMSCVGGVHVLDGETLAPLGRISLRSIAVDGHSVGAHLLAMEYVPPHGDIGGKLLLLVTESTLYESPVTASTNPRQVAPANLTYLVQLDPASMQQEWAVRLDACRGARHSSSYTDDWNLVPRPHPAAIVAGGSFENAAIWVGCHANGTALTSALVRVPLDADGKPDALPARVSMPGAGDQPDQADAAGMAAPSPSQVTVTGPDRVSEMLSDPVSGRILLKVVDNDAEVWWVFDGRVGQMLGTIGIGPVPKNFLRWTADMTGLDRRSGQLYVLLPGGLRPGHPGGLYAVDVRRTPIAQALVYPAFANLGFVQEQHGRSLVIDSGSGGIAQILVPSQVKTDSPWFYRVLEDRRDKVEPPVAEGLEQRTLDLPEAQGVTSAAFDGAARGYGARLLMVGGIDAAVRVGPVDPTGVAYQCNHEQTTSLNRDMPCSNGDGAVLKVATGKPQPLVSPCTSAGREIVLAAVGPTGPALVDGGGSRGGAVPVMLGGGLSADLEAPASRCAPVDWNQVWTTALFGRAPVDEPSVQEPMVAQGASCLSSDEQTESNVGDAVSGSYAAQSSCETEDTQGFAYARGGPLPGLAVTEALSSYRIFRDPARGIVSRVESVVRGITIDGALQIDSVRGTAESWANGRRQPVSDADREQGYRANCDFERTAGSCFRRHIFGVRTPGYSCGPCGDERSLIEGLARALGSNGSVRLRDPDPRLSAGAENGFIAAIQKPDTERFADLALNEDLLQTVLPTLEIIRQAPPNRPVTSGGTRGRQIYQFAGVEVSSSYGIACLLVYDAVTNTCAAPSEPPGSITVNLTDPDGKALAGGAFEVRQDVDTDGVVGLKDALLPNGACVTADDGVGTCKFDALQPGSYLVSQVAAPPGYGKVSEPFVVELASGEARTVTFQNTSNVSTIAVSAADEAGKPVLGAQFAVYPDADSDGKVAADAQPAATCTTDESGGCSMQVSAGSYVLVQTSAPGRLEPIEPVAFTFASGGQTAAVGVVNYPAGGLPRPEPAAAPSYSDPPAQVVTETVNDYQPTAEVADEPQVSIPDAVGGRIVRVIQAPGDALRLLSRDPKQAVAWTASLMLFALAAMAIRRRQTTLELMNS